MKLFYISTLMVIVWLYVFVKLIRLDTKKGEFAVYKLILNKPDLKESKTKETKQNET